MKKAFLSLVRTEYLEDRTLGELYVDGTFFCHTLEDTARRDGIKIAEDAEMMFRIILTMRK